VIFRRERRRDSHAGVANLTKSLSRKPFRLSDPKLDSLKFNGHIRLLRLESFTHEPTNGHIWMYLDPSSLWKNLII
jgi:hypothetical protein